MVLKGGEPRFAEASDRSLLVSFGEAISPEAGRRVAALTRAFERHPAEGIVNLHPAYCSVLVVFDPLRLDHDAVRSLAEQRLALEDATASTARLIEVPVHYGGEFGPDLEDVASLHGLTPRAAAELHASIEYTAAFLGFAPGFAYLSGLPEGLATPRLESPRQRVPAGSVGIAGSQTAVYPIASPGGWRLIGRTELEVFRADRDPVSLIRIGDRVRFVPVEIRE
jgi:KipI family sensor histidine kinase inhibitor